MKMFTGNLVYVTRLNGIDDINVVNQVIFAGSEEEALGAAIKTTVENFPQYKQASLRSHGFMEMDAATIKFAYEKYFPAHTSPAGEVKP